MWPSLGLWGGGVAKEAHPEVSSFEGVLADPIPWRQSNNQTHRRGPPGTAETPTSGFSKSAQIVPTFA